MSIQTISVITKIIYIYKRTTTGVVSSNLYTYTESHLHIQNLYFYIYKSERGTYYDEPLLVCWPSYMQKIADILLCTYTDQKLMLSFTLSGKQMTYTETHALILNHNNHIIVTDIRIFMNSYNKFTYIIILVTNLCLFSSLVYGTELIHILRLISRRTHTYTSISLILVQISRRSYRAYAYTEVPLGTTRLIPIP